MFYLSLAWTNAEASLFLLWLLWLFITVLQSFYHSDRRTLKLLFERKSVKMDFSLYEQNSKWPLTKCRWLLHEHMKGNSKTLTLIMLIFLIIMNRPKQLTQLVLWIIQSNYDIFWNSNKLLHFPNVICQASKRSKCIGMVQKNTEESGKLKRGKKVDFSFICDQTSQINLEYSAKYSSDDISSLPEAWPADCSCYSVLKRMTHL